MLFNKTENYNDSKANELRTCFLEIKFKYVHMISENH